MPFTLDKSYDESSQLAFIEKMAGAVLVDLIHKSINVIYTKMYSKYIATLFVICFCIRKTYVYIEQLTRYLFKQEAMC